MRLDQVFYTRSGRQLEKSTMMVEASYRELRKITSRLVVSDGILDMSSSQSIGMVTIWLLKIPTRN